MARKKQTKESKESALSKAIRQCVDSGKVVFGFNRSVKRAMNGNAKLILLSSNCPENQAGDIEKYCRLSSLPMLKIDGTSLELGTIAGKPFPISALAVIDAGNSGILELSK